jgi:Leucine-rich repeat (LRR) protein
MPAWPLPAFATLVEQFPAELIDMIQAFCSDKDLLSLTSVDKTALAIRFSNPRLQQLCFKMVKNTAHFLSYCQAIQDRQAQELILEEGQKSRKRLKSTLSPDSTTQFTLFTREHLQKIKTLTLTISDQFTAEQYALLFTYLPAIQHLTIFSEKGNYDGLSTLLKAVQNITLQNLAIYSNNGSVDKRADHLPDELWQFTTLETLTIKSFQYIGSIPEDISQLTLLKSLTLGWMRLQVLPASIGQLDKLKTLDLEALPISTLPEDIDRLTALKLLTLRETRSLKALPASFCRLNKLEALTLKQLPFFTKLPEDIGRLRTLKLLTLEYVFRLKALPASIGQLDKLEALTLTSLFLLTALPEEIGQLKALKSLELKYLGKLKALPASIGQLKSLEAITLNKLRALTALPEEIGQLKTLKIVKLVDMRGLETLPGKLAQIVTRKVV